MSSFEKRNPTQASLLARLQERRAEYERVREEVRRLDQIAIDTMGTADSSVAAASARRSNQALVRAFDDYRKALQDFFGSFVAEKKHPDDNPA